MTGADDGTMRSFEEALSHLDEGMFDLTLFVTGATDLSARAISNVQQLCERYLPGRCHLSVVDLFDHPEQAQRAGVVAAPTLVRNSPLPVRRLVGDMSHTDKVLSGLQIHVGSSVTD